MKRKLISGRVVKELNDPVNIKMKTVTDIVITTKAPGKWVMVDLETCDFWVSDNGHFRAAKEKELDEVQQAIDVRRGDL